LFIHGQLIVGMLAEREATKIEIGKRHLFRGDQMKKGHQIQVPFAALP
jgi:hypothetical protein